LTDELARRLIELGVATLHEAAGRRGLLHGVRLFVGEPFAGPAITVALPAGDNLGLHLALEAAKPGSVVCVGSAGGGAVIRAGLDCEDGRPGDEVLLR
jgi:4-hydroxy-4-methyl-2-oxoglutarate aldolase